MEIPLPARTRARLGALALGAAALAGRPDAAAAQLVTPKTVPVHQGEQFAIFPSSRPGMAGVSIALDDTLADPFSNPARAARLRGGTLFGVPSAHAHSGSRGGGRTLPLGAMGSVGAWSGAGVLALQQLDRAGAIWNLPTSERSATNRYLSGTLARRLPGGVAVGASAFRADLDAVDGVDLLYAGSDRIRQAGSLTDFRLGVLRDGAAGSSLDLLLLHSRTDVTHDVHFPVQIVWDRLTGRPSEERPARDEHNVDRTHVWGAHAEYSVPFGREGWRVGWLATANRLSHPKIPNYVIMNIPRDPGTTYAFNAGVGAARTQGRETLGVDLVYEPMWSETWADAARDTARAGGGVIPAGGHTVDNRFRFANVKLRIGLGYEVPLSADSASALGWQLGLAAYSVDYRLEQTNHVLGTERTQREDWMEWSPNLALRLRTRGLEVAYAFRLTCGPGGCELPVGMDDTDLAVAPVGTGGIIAAPSGPLFFDSGSVHTHRFTVMVPLR